MLNFQLQVDAEEKDVAYIRYRLSCSLERFAHSRLIYEGELKEARFEGEEYDSWIRGEISL